MQYLNSETLRMNAKTNKPWDLIFSFLLPAFAFHLFNSFCVYFITNPISIRLTILTLSHFIQILKFFIFCNSIITFIFIYFYSYFHLYLFFHHL